jgi:Tetratricopeptide repeat
MKDFLLGFSKHLATLAQKDFWDQIGGIGAILGLLLPLIGFVVWLVKRGQRKSIAELDEKIAVLTEDTKNLLSQKKQLASDLAKKNQIITDLERESPNSVHAAISRELSESNYGKVSKIAKTFVDLNYEAMAEAYYWLSREKWREVLGFSDKSNNKPETGFAEDENEIIQNQIETSRYFAKIATQINLKNKDYKNWFRELDQIQNSYRTTLLINDGKNISFLEDMRLLRKKYETNMYSHIALNSLSISLSKQGYHFAELYAAEEAFLLAKKALGFNDPDLFNIEGNLAISYGNVELYDRKRHCLENLLPREKAVLGENHSDVLTTENNLALTYFNLADYKLAKVRFESLLPRRQNILGKNHPATMTTEANLAITVGKLGDYDRQMQMLADLLPRRDAALGKNHPDVFSNESSLATAEGDLKLFKQQKERLENLLPRRQAVLGVNHSDCFVTERNLAIACGELKEFDQQKQRLEALLVRMQSTLGRNHCDVLQTEYYLASSYGHLGMGEIEEKYLDQLLSRAKRVLDDDDWLLRLIDISLKARQITRELAMVHEIANLNDISID